MVAPTIQTTTHIKNDVSPGLVEIKYEDSMPVAEDNSSSMPVDVDHSTSLPIAADQMSSMPVSTDGGNSMPMTGTETSSTPVVPDGAERQFEITHGDDMAECFATDLKTLQEECATGLQLEENSFNITYQIKGKTVVLKTEGNFKMMCKRQPNSEGSYEVNCVLKEVVVEPQIEIPSYVPSPYIGA